MEEEGDRGRLTGEEEEGGARTDHRRGRRTVCAGGGCDKGREAGVAARRGACQWAAPVLVVAPARRWEVAHMEGAAAEGEENEIRIREWRAINMKEKGRDMYGWIKI